jgi:AraC-like DNA-binding protein
VAMKIEFIPRRTELMPYVQSIWIFASPIGMQPSENNLAAPNGCPKLIFNYENSITSIVEGRVQESRERCLYFAGTRDNSAFLRTSPGKACCVGIEFYPYGAYPVFGIPMAEMTNRLLPAEALSAEWRREVCDILPELKSARDAANFIQDQLVGMLERRHIKTPLIEYCVSALKSTNGLIAISNLESKTGYTRRYLEILFRDHVGFSPKVLAGIFRFQKFYRKWAHGHSYDEIKDELYEYYYDQAHFAKEFKRMTGFSPQHFSQQVSNEFGRRLLLH